MVDLSFTKSFRYLMKREIYASEESQSWFYEAFDDTEKRTVGIKKVRLRYGDLAGAQAEANVIHSLSTVTTQVPALYQTYYDRQEEMYYLIMQYIDGGATLRQSMNTGMPIGAVVDLFIKICDVLTQLHKKRFQHRDLRPENILVKENQIFIIDFNVTAAVPFKGEGTNRYRAPEQTAGMRQIGLGAIDQFAVGVMMYEMLTGQPPVQGADYSFRRGADEWRFFTSPTEKKPDIPAELSEIVMTCLKLNPRQRYRDMWQLKQALIQAKRRLR